MSSQSASESTSNLTGLLQSGARVLTAAAALVSAYRYFSAPRKQGGRATSADLEFLRDADVLSIADMTRAQIEAVQRVASRMREHVKANGEINLCSGKVLANLFYEPSTRTSSSFHTAMMRLGGSVLPLTDVSNSSVAKGETLSDTVKCLQSYCDVLVLRHPQTGSVALAAEAANRIPVLNAGDGVGEHPTQALLDLFTITQKLGAVDGLTVTMLGDLKNGRTVHSLAKLLAKFTNVTVNYVSPDSLRMPSELVASLAAAGLRQTESASLDAATMGATDVLYVTRVQKERFATPDAYQAVANSFVVDARAMTNAKQRMIVMHPLPRVNEIAVEVDADPRAAYFDQMESGLFVRMALIAMVLGRVPKGW